MFLSSVRIPISIGLICPFLATTIACGGEEEPPTEEQLLAERLGALVEAQEGEHAPVTEQELRTWEAKIRQFREETEPELYQNFVSCMESATTFSVAEECFYIIDPQDSEETVPDPASIDEICSLWNHLYSRAGNDTRTDLERTHCARTLAPFKKAVEQNWRSFGECAEDAETPSDFDECRIAALPSISDHCSQMETMQIEYGRDVAADYAVSCARRLTERLANASLQFRAELSCCINEAQNPLEIDACLTRTVPNCSVD